MVNRKGTKDKRSINSVPLCLCACLPHKKGFSFIEAMVVIAIIGVLIVASQPLFRQFSRTQNLKSGANVVASTLRTTRGKAITDRKRYRTVLDTVNQVVCIYDSNDTLVEKWKKLPDFVEFESWNIPNSYPPDNYMYYIEFEPRGSLVNTVPSEDTALLREESTQETRLIKVNALTGRIKIE